MTFLTWRRGLVLAAIDRLLAEPAGAGADHAAGGWDQLQRDLAHSLPPHEIRAAIDELLSSPRHSTPSQRRLLATLRLQASAPDAAASRSLG